MKQLTYSAIKFLGLTITVYLLGFALLFFIQVNRIPLIYHASFGLSWKGGGTWQKFQEYDRTGSYDAIILGSSRARQGYDPRIFEQQGLRVFNLGTSAQSMMHSDLLAREYIHRENTPLLILDLFDGAFRGDGMEPSIDLIQNQPSDWVALQIAWQMRDIRALNLLTLRFFSKSMEPMYQSEYYAGKGFEERRDSVQQVVDYQSSAEEPQAKQVRFFQDLLAHCQREGIQVLIVNHPQPHEYDPAQHEQFIQQIRPIAEKSGAILWDYGFAHQLNSRDHFYDHHHLNQAGVAIFNAELIQRMQENGILSLANPQTRP